MEPFGSIGSRLKEERERLGMGKTGFAEEAGITRKTQALYESNDRAPDAIYLAKIAAAGADVGYILTGARTPKPAVGVGEDSAEYRAVSPREARILDLLDDLDDDGLRQVQDIAEKEKRIKDLEAELAERRRKAG